VQPALPFLLPVLVAAGVAGAAAGWMLHRIDRRLAVLGAAVAYCLAASAGFPVRILLATDGNEPVLWGMWLAEWPLRIAGAAAGCWLAGCWLRRRGTGEHDAGAAIRASTTVHFRRDAHGISANKSRRQRRPARAALILAAAAVACVVPMLLHGWISLGLTAGGFVTLGFALGLTLRQAIHLLIAACWGWAIYGGASYLWHHDAARVLDLGRTLVLRFLPMAVTSVLILRTVRPADLVRVLRRAGLGAALILPLATAIRLLPAIGRDLTAQRQKLRDAGVWSRRSDPLRRPLAISRGLLGPVLSRLATRLAEPQISHR
jgi:hypothetical protein